MNPQYEKKEVVNLSVLVGLGFLLFLVAIVGYFFYGLEPLDGNTATRAFTVEKGESFKEIGARLSQESLIKSIAVFKMYSLFTGKAQKIQPGTYELSNAMSLPEIVDEITAAKRGDILVTIPEGLTVRDIGTVLQTAGVLVNKDDLTNFPIQSLQIDYPFLAGKTSLEGFLFPETYYFQKNSSAEDVVRKMLNVFSARAWTMLSQSRGWYNTLILASYLEREVPDASSREIVAGILLKRIAIGMPLQVDSSILYAKCNGETRGCLALQITKGDTALQSPYNTYLHTGFTPTPIANPGESTLHAALAPRASPYLYYLSSPSTQETYFSKTLQEHNVKKQKYLSS